MINDPEVLRSIVKEALKEVLKEHQDYHKLQKNISINPTSPPIPAYVFISLNAVYSLLPAMPQDVVSRQMRKRHTEHWKAVGCFETDSSLPLQATFSLQT